MSKVHALVLTSEYLPVVGEAHPLRRKYSKALMTATIVALALHLGGFTAWFMARNNQKAPVAAPMVKIVMHEMPAPPPLTQTEATPVNVSAQMAPPTVGIPEPVPDFQAPNLTIASTEQMAQALAPTDLNALNSGAIDSLEVNPAKDDDQNQNPDDFTKVEEYPELISITPPVFPEMARAAEAEGVVMVQCLVGKDGKVKDTRIISGNVMLNDAAITCAKSAIFKPALSQHQPVEVWVQLPVRFSLN